MALRFSPGRGAASLVLNSMVRGPQGTAATIAVGTVTPLAPGATPTVSNSGSSGSAILNFGLPATPTIAVGATSTLAAAAAATVANGGTSTAEVFNFGIPRGADSGLRYAFDASTVMGAPASGGLRLNNAALASVTAIAVNALNSDGVDVSAWIATWGNSTNTVKGSILLRKEASGAVLGAYTITSVVNNTTWLQLNLAYVSGSGSLSAADPVYLSPFLSGNKGNDGSVAGPGVSVDSEIALWSGTGGATLKRAAMTGVLKATAGVAAAATSGTDYLAPPSGTALLKANSGGALANATAGTDYLAPPAGTSILKGNSGGALANATAGTDYMHPGTTSALTAGFTSASVSAGTKSSGTYTFDPTAGEVQHVTNGGAHTFAPPATHGSWQLDYVNNASAGALTTSGWTKVTGDAFDTTNTHAFRCRLSNGNQGSTLDVQRLV